MTLAQEQRRQSRRRQKANTLNVTGYVREIPAMLVDASEGGLGVEMKAVSDAATRTMTFHSEAVHQGQTVRYREITQTRDDGAQVYRRLLPTTEGGEFEMIRATYRRR